MKTNREWIGEIHRLMEENPGLEVKFFVDSYEVSEFAYTDQSIHKVDITLWAQFDEQILTEADEIRDKLMDMDDSLTEEEADQLALDKSRPVILVYTGA